MAKDLNHQFMLLMEKMGHGYKTFVDLEKSSWKSTGITREIMAGVVASL